MRYLIPILIVVILVVILNWLFPNALDNQDPMHIVYITALLTLVGSGIVVRSKGQAAFIAKSIALWGVIFIILLAAYTYRYDILNSRMVTQLLPHRAQTHADGSVHIPMDNSGHFVVDAFIDGQTITFLVDTGATNIVLPPADAKKLGLDINQLKFTQRFTTANGTVQGAPITLPYLKIGSIRLANVPASVNSAPMPNALLGMRFFEYLSGFEVKGDVLILHP